MTFSLSLESIARLYIRMEFGLRTIIDRECHFDATTGADSCLIIIGNGFDRHHELATSYADYRNWLQDHDERVATDFESFAFAAESSKLKSNSGCKFSPIKEEVPRWSSLEESSSLNGMSFVMKRSSTRILI